MLTVNVLTERSLSKLKGVHYALATLIKDAAARSPIPFQITDGVRTLSRQQTLFATGKSWTMLSKHLIGHAVDIAAFPDGKLSWDYPHYEQIAAHIKALAAARGVPLVWGGDWSVRDGTHFELADSFSQVIDIASPHSYPLDVTVRTDTTSCQSLTSKGVCDEETC